MFLAILVFLACGNVDPLAALSPFRCESRSCPGDIDAYIRPELEPDSCLKIELDGGARRYLSRSSAACPACPGEQAATKCLVMLPGETPAVIWAPTNTRPEEKYDGIIADFAELADDGTCPLSCDLANPPGNAGAGGAPNEPPETTGGKPPIVDEPTAGAPPETFCAPQERICDENFKIRGCTYRVQVCSFDGSHYINDGVCGSERRCQDGECVSAPENYSCE